MCTWAILWGLSGSLSWEDGSLENLVLPGIHRKLFVLTGTHSALKRPRVSSNYFPLKSARTWKSWSRLQSCHSRSLVWGTRDITLQAVSVSDAAEETEALSVVCQMTCEEVSDGARTGSKVPGSLTLTWDDYRNSDIPVSKLSWNHGQNETGITNKNKLTNALKEKYGISCFQDRCRFLQQEGGTK